MDDIVKEFLVESYESLDRLDQDLVSLERDPKDHKILGSIFRTVHSLKGTSGFLAFGKVEAVSHVAEDLLTKLRDGVMEINSEIAKALLTSMDAVRVMLKTIESEGYEGDGDHSEIIAELTRLKNGSTNTGAPGISEKHAPPLTTAIPATVPIPIPSKRAITPEAVESEPAIKTDPAEIEQRAPAVSDIAAAFCARTKPSTIILSLSLPDGSAFPFIQKLRGDKTFVGVPIIGVCMVTAQADQQRARQNGANAILHKPLTPANIQAALEKSLNIDTTSKCFAEKNDRLIITFRPTLMKATERNFLPLRKRALRRRLKMA